MNINEHKTSTSTFIFLIGMSDCRNCQDFFPNALHEIGHILGLKHSDDKNSVMWPIAHHGHIGLQEDDIKGIQALYGKRKPLHGKEIKSLNLENKMSKGAFAPSISYFVHVS